MDYFQTLSTTAIVLEKMSDWTRWYEQFKHEATLLDVWEDLDPDSEETTLPPSRVKPSENISDEIWSVDYRILSAEYSQRKRDLIKMATYFWRTISQGYKDSLEKNVSTRQNLKDLRSLCKYSNFQREELLESSIEKLLNGPQGQSYDQWAQAWLGVLMASKEIPETVWPERRLYREFVKACLTILPAYGEKKMAEMIEQGDDSGSFSLREAIRQFSAWASFGLPKRNIQKGAFATLDGKIINTVNNSSSGFKTNDLTSSHPKNSPKPKEKRKERTAPKCPCGERHYFNQCEHINAALRKPGYVENHNIIEKIRNWFHDNDEKYGKMVSSLEKNNGLLAEFLQDKESYATVCQSYSSRRVQDESVILDTATTNHVFHQKSRFINYKELEEPIEVRTGDSQCFIIGMGSVRLKVSTDKGPRNVRIDNVQHIPGFHVNIVAYKAFRMGGAYLDGKTNWIRKVKDDSCVAICENSVCGSFLILEKKTHQEKTNMSQAIRSTEQRISTATSERWHKRLGHLSEDNIRHLSENVDGVVVTNPSKKDNHNNIYQLCEICNTASGHTRISRQLQYKGITPFQLTHIDLIHQEPGLSNERYIFHFYCQKTKFNLAYVTTDRTQKTLLGCFTQAHGMIKKWGFDISCIRMDQEAGLQSEFDEYCLQHSIWQEKTPTGTKEQNGAAERSGGWIVTVTRRLILQSGLPTNLWPYFTLAAVRIINRTPKKALDYKTPYELVTKRRPDLSGYRIPGSKVFVTKRGIPSLKKQSTKSEIGYYISNSARNISIVWIPYGNKVVASRDVRVDEMSPFSWKDVNDPELIPTFEDRFMVVNYNNTPLIDNLIEDITENQNSGASKIHTDTVVKTTENIEISKPSEDYNNNLSIDQVQTQFPTPEATPEAALEPPQVIVPRNDIDSSSELPESSAEANDEISQKKSVSKKKFTEEEVLQRLRESSREFRANRRNKLRDEYNFFTEICERKNKANSTLQEIYASFFVTKHQKLNIDQLQKPPTRWETMLKHPESAGFIDAARQEMEAQDLKSTWKEVEKPENIKALPLKWVFTYKLDDKGFLVKYKARICVRGDLQPYTGEDLYAATGAYRTFRIFMAIVAAFDLECDQMDAVNAFLNAPIKDEIYVQWPPGYKKRNTVLRLNRALYGLRMSPKLWFYEISSLLATLGFEYSPEDHCLMIHNSLTIIIFIYVDDFLVASPLELRHHLDEIKSLINAKYELRDLGKVKRFLNLDIHRDRKKRTLHISMPSYIDKVVSRFHLQHAKIPRMPLTGKKLIPYEGTATPEEINSYQQRIGNLIYPAVVLRPDISYAASMLSRFNQNPGPEHVREADHVIAYLAGTKALGIMYKGNISDDKSMLTASDASFADDSSRSSTQGFLVKLFNGPISWQSTLQRTIVLSTTEAEMMALTSIGREVMSIRRLFKSIRFDPECKSQLLCDNLQTINSITKEHPQMTSKMKHIDIHRLWIRQECKKGVFAVLWVPTKDQPADGFTKALTIEKHREFLRRLDMCSIPKML